MQKNIQAVCLLVLALYVGGTICAHRWADRVMLWSAQNNIESVVRLCVAHGCDVDAQDQLGRTVLHFAARNGAHRLIEWLYSQQPSPAELKVNVAEDTPLHVAVLNGQFSAVQALLAHGDDEQLGALNGDNKRPIDMAFASPPSVTRYTEDELARVVVLLVLAGASTEGLEQNITRYISADFYRYLVCYKEGRISEIPLLWLRSFQMLAHR